MNFKRTKMLSLAALACVSAWAQAPEVFQPYQKTDLRLPSVPLIVSDPYFSIWSPYDKLTDGSTRHWTNDEKPLQGWLRVDGVPYSFMGVDTDVFDAIAPMADEGGWEARYSREKQTAGWEKPGFNDSSWKTGTAAFGTADLSFVRTEWSDLNSDLYVRRVVDVTAAGAGPDDYLFARRRIRNVYKWYEGGRHR